MKEWVIFGILKDKFPDYSYLPKYHILSSEKFSFSRIIIDDKIDISVDMKNRGIEKERFISDDESYNFYSDFLKKYIFDRDYNYYRVEFGSLNYIIKQIEEIKLLQEII